MDDEYKYDAVVYWIAVLQGFGMYGMRGCTLRCQVSSFPRTSHRLLPWNIVINTIPYLDVGCAPLSFLRPRSPIVVVQSLYPSSSLQFFVSVVSTAPQLPMLFIMASPIGTVLPSTLRIVSMLAVQALAMVLLGFCAHLSVYIVYACFLLLGLSGVILQSSVMGVTRCGANVSRSVRDASTCLLFPRWRAACSRPSSTRV